MSDRVIPETEFQGTKATRMSDFDYGLAEKNRYAEAKLAIDSLRGSGLDATINFADPMYSNLEDQSCDWLWEDEAYLAAEARYQAAVVSNNSATGTPTLVTALIQTDDTAALELNECHCPIKRAAKSAHKSAQQKEQFVQAWVGAEYMLCILDNVSEPECASRTKPVPTLTLPQFSSAVEGAVCAGATTESTVLAE